MKILWLTPIYNTDVKVPVVRTDIEIPDSVDDCEEFLQTACAKIYQAFKDTAADRMKIVYGETLPEYQVVVDFVNKTGSDDFINNVIRSALLVIVKSRVSDNWIKWNPDIPGEIPMLPEGTKVLVRTRGWGESYQAVEYTQWDWRQDLGHDTIVEYKVVNL